MESTRRPFTKDRFLKSDTSRARSSELYLLASGFRMV
jgi:23S rRNA U2552 (ribose-2'-O)-methylase RlmE/FtsJ